MASFKQLFSVAPAHAVDELVSGRRLVYYAFIAFTPGTLAWIVLEDAKKEMEQENEAARLVMLAKARTQVEKDEANEAQKKAQLDALAAKLDALQNRMHAVEHVVLGTPLPEVAAQSSSIEGTTLEPREQEVPKTQPQNWSVAALWVRLREIWDEEDDVSWEDLMSIESWKAAWSEFYDKLMGNDKKQTTVKAETLWNVLDQLTTPKLKRNPDDVRAMVKAMLRPTEQEQTIESSKSSIENTLEKLKDMWHQVFEEKAEDDSPVDPLEAKVYAKLHQSEIHKRKQLEEKQFHATDLHEARASGGPK